MSLIHISNFVPPKGYYMSYQNGTVTTFGHGDTLPLPVLDIADKPLAVGDEIAVPIHAGTSSATMIKGKIKTIKMHTTSMYDYNTRTDVKLDNVVYFTVHIEGRKFNRESVEVAKI